jgi:hypothetical protein
MGDGKSAAQSIHKYLSGGLSGVALAKSEAQAKMDLSAKPKS